jgi:anaerobic magnesium-protoporphyrin IX monomethyl ester cyclase
MARLLWVEKKIDYEPQGIMSMTAVLREAGHEVEMTIAAQEDPVEVARAFRPDILGFSVMTGNQSYYADLNRQLRQALVPARPLSVFGGPHATFFADIIHDPDIDGVCIGEGEGPILDLAESLDNGELDPHIYNWHFKVNGEIIQNPIRPLVHDLGSLPLPDRTIIYDKHAGTRQSPIKTFIAGRGCPYGCTYCFNHAWYKKFYPKERRGYMRSVDHVIREALWVKERYPLEQLLFVDDLFILFDDWLEEFADRFPKEVGIPFFCNVRANLVTPEKVALLKKAGANTVSMGIESGSDHIRNELLRRRMLRETIVRAGQLFHEAGIVASSTNMLALPTATLEDDISTMRLNIEAKIKYAHAFLFQPYPGTELGEYVETHDLFMGSMEDISAIAWDRSLIKRDDHERTQMENLQRWFALGVEFPWLEPLIRQLIKAPHNPVTDNLYWLVNKLFKGYVVSRRLHPFKIDIRMLWKQVIEFLRMET